MKKKRRVSPDKIAAAVGSPGGRYESIPVPEAWKECSACGTPARVLDDENKECIGCRASRMKRMRTACATDPF